MFVSDEVRRWRCSLVRTDTSGLSDAERIDLLRGLEELKAAAAGLQTVLTADLAEDAHAHDHDGDGRVIAGEVGLARRESIHRATRRVTTANRLCTEMPHTVAALRAGCLSEYRAELIARETECLGAEDRRVLDAELCADPSRLDGWGDRRVANEARKVAYRLDPDAALARAANAEQDRFVSIRPAPDTMVRLTALLPVTEGVAVYAALHGAAERARCVGDPRSRSQLMADALVERVTTTGTGSTTGGSARTSGARVVVNLVMTDRALLAGDAEPAHLDGFGTVPAGWARNKLAEYLDHTRRDTTTEVLVRRLFTAPSSGALIGMESHARHAPAGLADLIRLRTRPAASRGATPRSATPTISTATPTAAPPARRTWPACARPTTTPTNAPTGTTTHPARRGQRHMFIVVTPTAHRHPSAAPVPVGSGD